MIRPTTYIDDAGRLFSVVRDPSVALGCLAQVTVSENGEQVAAFAFASRLDDREQIAAWRILEGMAS